MSAFFFAWHLVCFCFGSVSLFVGFPSTLPLSLHLSTPIPSPTRPPPSVTNSTVIATARRCPVGGGRCGFPRVDLSGEICEGIEVAWFDVSVFGHHPTPIIFSADFRLFSTDFCFPQWSSGMLAKRRRAPPTSGIERTWHIAGTCLSTAAQCRRSVIRPCSTSRCATPSWPSPCSLRCSVFSKNDHPYLTGILTMSSDRCI